MTQSQPSTLLPSLFEHIDEGRRLTVLHIGPALAETVEFFSRYRCKLHFIDLFSDLHQLAVAAEANSSLQQTFIELMHIPADTRFDLCLFWDLFNFLDRDAARAFISALRPHLDDNCLAHGFGVHNLRTPQSGLVYGIGGLDRITLRRRPAELPGYSPCNQGQLEKLLDCFKVTRSVLLPDSRLELLLAGRP